TVRVRVSNPVKTIRRAPDQGSRQIFETEMLSLDLTGLPGGVMIRESPTRASLGRTSIEPNPDGTYRIGSFFDVFTEISLDGGANWTPATAPATVVTEPGPPPITLPTPLLPPDGQFVTRDGFVTYYRLPPSPSLPGGRVICVTTICHGGFTQFQPPPPPGGSQLMEFNSQASLLASANGGLSFSPVTLQGLTRVQVRSSQDSGNTR